METMFVIQKASGDVIEIRADRFNPDNHEEVKEEEPKEEKEEEKKVKKSSKK